MPIYPPRNEPVRKKEILKKRETEIIHAIESRASEAVVRKAAEKVRFAHLKLIKGKVESVRYSRNEEQRDATILKAKRDTEHWENVAIEDIIAMYSTWNA